ncbi:unnamed protein product [Meloidogyne enterolobii]|uniref:Uncharacterized protein n=1 Tax=Meloidogyne enterolobii TaxID=390850 RepID=A0ACB0XUQ8_MELEN
MLLLLFENKNPLISIDIGVRFEDDLIRIIFRHWNTFPEELEKEGDSQNSSDLFPYAEIAVLEGMIKVLSSKHGGCCRWDPRIRHGH